MWPEIVISVTAAPMKGDKKYISRISKHSGSDVFTEFIEKYIMKVLQGVKSSVHRLIYKCDRWLFYPL